MKNKNLPPSFINNKILKEGRSITARVRKNFNNLIKIKQKSNHKLNSQGCTKNIQ
jgi:hypothetical protein